jgi:adenine-specific DNA-methyltransferase
MLAPHRQALPLEPTDRMIKYLGSKRTLVPLITDVITRLPQVNSAIDLFSGTSRVGQALKAAGLQVLANDHNRYAATLARGYVQADREDWLGAAEQLVAEFNALPLPLLSDHGWFVDTYCVQSRFFQPHAGARIEQIRQAIAAKSLDPELEAVLLVALLEAADRVDSTTGVQMAYLKQWAKRSFNPLVLRVPELLPRATGGKGSAHELEALEAARSLKADVAYLDPPYNQHKYIGNYHIWETLVRWDQPEVYGTARKRIDVRDRHSDFNSVKRAQTAFAEVIASLDARFLVVSFSDEGYIDRQAMEQLLQTRGEVLVMERDFKRYVGAQIGIHNPQGQKVGAVSHLRNTEYLFVVAPNAADLTKLLDL